MPDHTLRKAAMSNDSGGPTAEIEQAVAAVLDEEDVLRGLELEPGTRAGAGLRLCRLKLAAVADLMVQARIAHLLGQHEEAKQLQMGLKAVRKALALAIQEWVPCFVDFPALAYSPQNWIDTPVSLRPVLLDLLQKRGIDASLALDKARELEREGIEAATAPYRRGGDAQ